MLTRGESMERCRAAPEIVALTNVQQTFILRDLRFSSHAIAKIGPLQFEASSSTIARNVMRISTTADSRMLKRRGLGISPKTNAFYN